MSAKVDKILFAILLIVIVIIAVIAANAEERSADNWFALAVEIQRDIEQADFENRKLEHIDAEDRRFVRKMVNELSVSADAKPTAAQGVWLIKIREWLAEEIKSSKAK